MECYQRQMDRETGPLLLTVMMAEKRNFYFFHFFFLQLSSVERTRVVQSSSGETLEKHRLKDNFLLQSKMCENPKTYSHINLAQIQSDNSWAEMRQSL